MTKLHNTTCWWQSVRCVIAVVGNRYWISDIVCINLIDYGRVYLHSNFKLWENNVLSFMLHDVHFRGRHHFRTIFWKQFYSLLLKMHVIQRGIRCKFLGRRHCLNFLDYLFFSVKAEDIFREVICDKCLVWWKSLILCNPTADGLRNMCCNLLIYIYCFLFLVQRFVPLISPCWS